MLKKKIKRNYRIGRYIVYRETLVDHKEIFWSFLGSFVGVAAIGFVQSKFFLPIENVFLVGSFGATCVLIYGSIQSPLAQPRNLVGGHLISALIGVTVYKLVPDPIWISAPLAVSLSIIAMQFTKTLHPPGGATSLIAVIGTDQITSLGYLYALFPILSGVGILLLVALIFNNMTDQRKYPTDGRFSRSIKWVVSATKTKTHKLKRKLSKYGMG